MAPGSCKDLGYFSFPSPHAKTIVLCESAIDAVSCAALYPQHLCISTAGARPNPRWLPPLIRRAHQVYCGFDSDRTGDDMAQAMITLHPSVKRLRTPHPIGMVALAAHGFAIFGQARRHCKATSPQPAPLPYTLSLSPRPRGLKAVRG